MYVEHVELCNSTLYKSGLLIISKPIYRDPDDFKEPKQKKIREYIVKPNAVRSACVDLWHKRKSKNLLFFTVTIPFKINEVELSRIWNHFLNNLRNNYKVTNYVWVKEIQTKTGNIHYHVLVDRNRIGIKHLQDTWNNCINFITGTMPKFNNSVRLGKRPIVSHIQTVANYLSKYITKGDDAIIFCSRAYGYSKSFIIKRPLSNDEILRLWHSGRCKMIISDHFFNVYIVDNFYDLPEFWAKLLL